MLVGLTSSNPEVTPLELRTLAEWTVRPRLLGIPGVAQITTIGGDLPEFQVLADPHKLQALNLSLPDLEKAVAGSNANTTGGILEKTYTEELVRNIARIQSAEDLAKAVIPAQREGKLPLTLDQVAEIRVAGPIAKRGDAGVNAMPGVILSVRKQPGADTLKLTEQVEAQLRELQQSFPEGVVVHDEIFQQADFIERAVTNVEHALRDGSIMVIIVLFIFLLNFRTTFITLTAIPLSLLITAIIFHWFGLSINTMTLGGLAVAIGELVDDAIVDVENVFRRLRENRLLAQPKPVVEVIYKASCEVRNSIVFATIIVVLVFIPLFALGGIEGRIFAPLGLAYIVSILASLGVALTVTPALCSYLLPGMKRMAEEKDGWMVRKVKAAEEQIILWAVPKTWSLLGVVAALFLAALAVVPFLGREFLPPFNEGSVTISLILPVDANLSESNRIGRLAETLIREVPEVSITGRRTGRAEEDEHASSVNSSEIEVDFKESRRSREAILNDIRDRLAVIPGLTANIGQPISHRIDHILSGVRAQIAVKIFGDNLDILRMKAAEIESLMSGVAGVVDLQTEQVTLTPQVHVRVDREQAAKYGLMAGEVAELAELAMNGKRVTQVLEGSKSFDVVLRLKDDARNDIEALKQIPLRTVDGRGIPLGAVARIEQAKGPNTINREGSQRRIAIFSNVSGRDLVGTVDEIRKKIAEQVELPQGYFVTYGGQFESQEQASRMIVLLSLVSFSAMFGVLYAHFKSAMFAGQIMLNIPFAFIGAVLGIVLTGGTFSIATMVGFITLTGIAARNGIMMIAHYMHLMKHEGEQFNIQMIIRGTQERIIPVLMTALTASLALIPLLFGAGEPGREILHPVAVVIFSGIFTSTLLDLVITPLVFWKFAGKSVARLLEEQRKASH
jgi:CzcA family heavy metal efflux pump